MDSYIPEKYKPVLGIYDTQRAISILKRTFESNLSRRLNLMRVSAPLFVEGSSGLNDDLNGVERPVSFDIPDAHKEGQVVHSLAKWKRMALHRYGFAPGAGIYTDMNAIRRDEHTDNLHSIYVDQWDWEKVITSSDRNLSYLKETVSAIVTSIADTSDIIKSEFPAITADICRDISFVTSQELEDAYPELSAKERENKFVKEHRTTFIMQIGGALRSGSPHDGRAPDYDDWSLNGDIMFWDDVLDSAIEISSMGIRVDPQSLDKQLSISGCDSRRSLPFHRMLLCGELPLTIGGGIGQSRLCMLLLQKAHIGEVQASIWDDRTIDVCKRAGVTLL
ncbi:MAG: aspartate--ammonia ligase [Oscillospiraceae bacterium]